MVVNQSVEKRNHLDGFTQSHLISQYTISGDLSVAQQPVKSFNLISPKNLIIFKMWRGLVLLNRHFEVEFWEVNSHGQSIVLRITQTKSRSFPLTLIYSMIHYFSITRYHINHFLSSLTIYCFIKTIKVSYFRRIV